jgi:2,3-dihydroxyphenylpropionate 1,2-dioxygenase
MALLAAAGFSHNPFQIKSTPTGPAQTGFCKAAEKLGKWIADFDPELMVIFTPDHYNGFFYDLMPPFCIGVEAHGAADWDLPQDAINVPSDIARACVDAVRAADIDAAISHRMTVDHGVTIPLLVLTGGLRSYPVLPIFINCVAEPFPRCRRVRLLGHAVGRFAASLDRRVLFLGSGGLSHDPPAPRLVGAPPETREFVIAGRNISREEDKARQERVFQAARDLTAGSDAYRPPNAEFDCRVLDHLAMQDLAVFDDFDNDWVDREGGIGGNEIRTWIAAFAALNAAGAYEAEVDFYAPIVEWMTGMAIARAWQS